MVDSNAVGVVLRSCLVLGNTIAGNGFYGVYYAVTAGDVGLANYMLINNNPSGTSQILDGVDLQPNACSDKPCH
jgi:hypothetical protein